MRKTFRAEAEATAAKGTRRERMRRVFGVMLLRRGTRAFRPTATEQEAETAMRYDLPICDKERGVDLFAFALLTATLRDWLPICQRRVPVVYIVSILFRSIYVWICVERRSPAILGSTCLL